MARNCRDGAVAAEAVGRPAGWASGAPGKPLGTSMAKVTPRTTAPTPPKTTIRHGRTGSGWSPGHAGQDHEDGRSTGRPRRCRGTQDGGTSHRAWQWLLTKTQTSPRADTLSQN